MTRREQEREAIERTDEKDPRTVAGGKENRGCCDSEGGEDERGRARDTLERPNRRRTEARSFPRHRGPVFERFSLHDEESNSNGIVPSRAATLALSPRDTLPLPSVQPQNFLTGRPLSSLLSSSFRFSPSSNSDRYGIL